MQIALSCLACAHAASEPAAAAPASTGPSQVIALDKSTFDEKVSYWGEDEWLLEFYAPWCSHCQSFMPTYDKIATVLAAVNKKVAKIDCVASKEVCTRFGISSFPSIKL